MNKLNVVLMIAAFAAGSAQVSAQDKFPVKPIRMLVPFSAGSATDFFARGVGQKLSETWGQQIVVDNRPSAGGVIASELLLNAPADGYTLMMVSIGHAVNASLYSKLPYNTVKDFAGIWPHTVLPARKRTSATTDTRSSPPAGAICRA